MAGRDGDHYPKRGEVWWANLGDLDPTKGADMQRKRPVLIVGKNIINQKRKTVLVIPLATSKGAPVEHPPITVAVTCAGKHAVAVVDQLRAMDKNRLMNCIGTLASDNFEQVIVAMRQVLQLA